ncbi:unnamed protein product [Aphanomyces euteiches]
MPDFSFDVKIFVTGATGFVGSAVVQELLRAGHQVTGLARSQASADALTKAGANVHKGDLDDLDSLRAGEANADAVIHLGFNHDFSKYMENCAADGRAIRALGEFLVGSNRLLIVTSGMVANQSGDDTPDELVGVVPGVQPLGESEVAAEDVMASGVRVVIVRLPPSVHGEGDKGFIPLLISIAREKGVAAYVGSGDNRWPAVHRLGAAVLYRLVVEKSSESGRVHAIAHEGIPFREIAQVIAKAVNVPVVS